MGRSERYTRRPRITQSDVPAPRRSSRPMSLIGLVGKEPKHFSPRPRGAGAGSEGGEWSPPRSDSARPDASDTRPNEGFDEHLNLIRRRGYVEFDAVAFNRQAGNDLRVRAASGRDCSHLAHRVRSRLGSDKDFELASRRSCPQQSEPREEGRDHAID